MLYQHKKTGETREFVQGMKIAEEWSPLHVLKTEHGTITLGEVDAKSITSIKAQKAAETRAKNKAKKEAKK